MDGSLVVLLAPITHSEPGGAAAVEIPPKVKAHLALDWARSWVIVDEVNETAWPGFGLQPNVEGKYAYGFLPPRLYNRIKDAMLAAVQARQLKRVPR